ncbi:MAG: cysteine hydrolase family protein [Armatimonadota bacterium]
MTVWNRLGVQPPFMVRLFGGLAEWKIDKARTALMIVDMQNYCACAGKGIWTLAHERGMGSELEYYYKRLDLVVRNLERLLRACREQSIEVIHINGDVQLRDRVLERTARFSSGYWGSGLEKGLAQRTYADDSEIVAPLGPLPHEIVIKKRGAGPFGVTNIDKVLRSLGIEFLIIGGTATHQCVEMTVRGASDFGYKTILVEDGTATVSEELQRNSLVALADWFCKVRTTDEILTGILDVKSEHAQSLA